MELNPAIIFVSKIDRPGNINSYFLFLTNYVKNQNALLLRSVSVKINVFCLLRGLSKESLVLLHTKWEGIHILFECEMIIFLFCDKTVISSCS